MNYRVRSKNLRCHSRGYSLVEVAISTGIVSAVALPLLALLASSHSMQSLARDQDNAARIAMKAVEGIVVGKDGTLEIGFAEETLILLTNLTKGDSRACFSFDADGYFLNQVDVSAWESGSGLPREAFYLLQIELSISESTNSLMDVNLSVAQPAQAAESVRSEEQFVTRIRVR